MIGILIMLTIMYAYFNASDNMVVVVNNDDIVSDNDMIPMRAKIYQRHASSHFKGRKIVHLDLKGAPPRVKYYKYFFSIMSSLGVDGILMEYEDMFPYHGNLEVLKRKESYTTADIQIILRWAKEYNLEIIPLVQTFGHLEFLLKHDKFSSLSELPDPRRAICPSNNQSLFTVKRLIDQVMALHPDTKYFHIGGDEVYELAKCAKCKKRSISREEIYIHHITAVYQFIKSKRPNINILFWEDMIREWSAAKMQKLHQLVPMVWAYRRNLDGAFPVNMWKNYKKVFGTVWIASAFKGALAPDNDFVPVDYHVTNHKSWMKIIKNYNKDINFEGIAITGWSRFDHHQPLCELLPAGIPSLALCIGVLNFGDFNNLLLKKISEDLKCKNNISTGFTFKFYIQEKCLFPGSKIFAIVSRWKVIYSDLMVLRRFFLDPSSYQDYEDRKILKNPKKSILELEKRLLIFETEGALILNEIYYPNTVSEWLSTKMKSGQELLEFIRKNSN